MAEGFLDESTTDWSRGQDAWHAPRMIQANQYASGVNVTCVGGNLSPRFGFAKKKLVFEYKSIRENKLIASRTIESIWRNGKFQAAIPYEPEAGSYIITVVSGLISAELRPRAHTVWTA